jgi:hypothetical protein
MKPRCCDTEKFGSCTQAENAVAWALGKGSDLDRTAIENHLRHCAACQAEATAARNLIERLLAQPEAEPSPGLTERIVAALPPPRPGRIIPWHGLRAWAAAAAAVLVATGIWLATGHAGHTPQQAVREGADWLMRTQAADGSWDPAATGGDPAYRPALTALAALALEEPRTVYRQAAVDRAVGALLALQQADGAFGPSGTTQPYNHGIVTCALLAIAAQRPGAVSESALQQAVAFVRKHQTAGGGWGYTPGDPPNTAITVWQIEALARARDLGWGDPDGHLRRGLRWLRAQAGGDGHFAYPAAGATAQGSPTLDAMGVYALFTAGRPHPELMAAGADTLRTLRAWAAQPAATADFYRDFCAVRALDQGGCRQLSANLRQRLAGARATSGAERGSWRPDEVWGRAGGRLYATALAMLVLK